MIAATPTETSGLKASYNLGYVWLISVVAAMGGLLFGWDWVVVGGAKPFFQRYFQLTSEAQIGWANSCALIGCLAGALAAGALSDKFGRKRLLVVAAIIFAATSLGNALAGNFTVFIAWRIFGGVAIGLASSLSPMYIAEIAPAQIRGKLVAINQLTVVVGILLAQYINWFLVRDLPQGATDEFIRNSWFGQQGWRWMFGLTAAPSLLFFAGMLLVPESPRWLAKNGKADRARDILAKIGGESYAQAATAEFNPRWRARKFSMCVSPICSNQSCARSSSSAWCWRSSSNGAASMSFLITPRRFSRRRAMTFPPCSKTSRGPAR